MIETRRCSSLTSIPQPTAVQNRAMRLPLSLPGTAMRDEQCDDGSWERSMQLPGSPNRAVRSSCPGRDCSRTQAGFEIFDRRDCGNYVAKRSDKNIDMFALDVPMQFLGTVRAEMKRRIAVSGKANRRSEAQKVYRCQEAEMASDPAFFCVSGPRSVA